MYLTEGTSGHSDNGGKESVEEDLDSSFVAPENTEELLIVDHNTEWLGGLERSDRMLLSILLHDILGRQYGVHTTESDEVLSSYLGVTDRTIWEWCSLFFANKGCFPNTLKGKYMRSCVWDSEDLNEQATRFV